MELSELVRKLKDKEVYHFARYGDGEWNVILGKEGCNTDGHDYGLPMLREDMCRTVRIKKGILYGMQPKAGREMKKEIAEFLEGAFIPWIDSDVFHKASIHGELNPFVQQLRKKKCCIVGPEHLRILTEKTSPNRLAAEFVETPKKNCFLERDAIAGGVMTRSREVKVILFSASFLSNILIWKLHTLLPEIFMIDVGSLWDPYVGVHSRKYHKALGPVLEKNFK